MKNLFTKWLAALLIATLLLTSVAFMETEPTVAVEESAEEIVEPEESVSEETVEETEEAEEPAKDPVDETEEPAEESEEPAEESEEEVMISEADAIVEEVDEAVVAFNDEGEAVEQIPELSVAEEIIVEESVAAEAMDAVEEAAAATTGPSETDFPDAAFRAYVANRFGGMTDYSVVSYMDFYSNETWSDAEGNSYAPKDIKSLKGIEKFTGLTSLYISETSITELDLSAITKLAKAVETWSPSAWETFVPDMATKTGIIKYDTASYPVKEEMTAEEIKQQKDQMKQWNDWSDEYLEQWFDEQYKAEDGKYYKSIGNIVFKTSVKVTPTPKKVKQVVQINETNFPDANFRQFVLENLDTERYDANGWFESDSCDSVPDVYTFTVDEDGNIKDRKESTYKYVTGDGWLSEYEVKQSYIRLYKDLAGGTPTHQNGTKYADVASLKGIEYFTELETLDIRNNPISEFDATKFLKLNYLYCDGTNIKTLDLSKCDEDMLKYIHPDYYHIDTTRNLVEYYDAESISNKPANVTDGVKYGTFVLSCNADVQITGGTPVAPFNNIIKAYKKKNTVTVIAEPGYVYKLDLGEGVTGKKFKSSKKKVATVAAPGIITIKKAGKTKITFKVGKKTRTVILTVKDHTIPSWITLNAPKTAVKVGEVLDITYQLPANTHSGIKWKSSDTKKAYVNENGQVVFKKKGSVTISATTKRGKKKASIKFYVSP